MDSNPVKAHQAEALLGDPLFDEVFDGLRDEAYADIRNSDPHDEDKRVCAYHDLRALDRIRAKLQSYPDNQKVLQKRIDKDARI